MAERGPVITTSKRFQPALLPCILYTIIDMLSIVGKNKYIQISESYIYFFRILPKTNHHNKNQGGHNSNCGNYAKTTDINQTLESSGNSFSSVTILKSND